MLEKLYLRDHQEFRFNFSSLLCLFFWTWIPHECLEFPMNALPVALLCFLKSLCDYETNMVLLRGFLLNKSYISTLYEIVTLMVAHKSSTQRNSKERWIFCSTSRTELVDFVYILIVLVWDYICLSLFQLFSFKN